MIHRNLSVIAGPTNRTPYHQTKSMQPTPANTRRNNNAIITPKRRRFDVIMTLLLRHVPAGIRWSGPADVIYCMVYKHSHCIDVIMSAMASQMTSLALVYLIVSGAEQRKLQSPASLAFVWGIHRWPVNFPHNRPVTRKMFDVIMVTVDRSHMVDEYTPAGFNFIYTN